jgi:hypothetical protein
MIAITQVVNIAMMKCALAIGFLRMRNESIFRIPVLFLDRYTLYKRQRSFCDGERWRDRFE